MKKIIFLLQALVILVFLGCRKNEPEIIQIPKNIELDLNQDDKVDFRIVYSQQAIEYPIDPSPSSEVVIGKFVSVEDNQILKREQESILFLNEIEQIVDDPITPYFWGSNGDEFSSSIMIIGQTSDGKDWKDEWQILNEEVKDSYLIGFKLLEQNSNQLGFIEFSIDKQTGQFEIFNIELF